MPTRKTIETRARIAAAALNLLREKGAAGLTMRKVASLTGLSLSNVQYHFGSREQLLVGITEHHLGLCREAMLTALGRQGAVSLRRVLTVSLLDPDVQHIVPPFRELFALGVAEPTVHELLMTHYRASHDQFMELLAAEFPEASQCTIAGVVGVLMTSIEGAYLIQPAIGLSNDELVEQLNAMATLTLTS